MLEVVNSSKPHLLAMKQGGGSSCVVDVPDWGIFSGVLAFSPGIEICHYFFVMSAGN